MCSIHFLSFLSFYGHHGTRLSARPNTHNTPSIGFCASLPPPLSHQPIVGTKWHLVFAFGCPFCSYPPTLWSGVLLFLRPSQHSIQVLPPTPARNCVFTPTVTCPPTLCTTTMLINGSGQGNHGHQDHPTHSFWLLNEEGSNISPSLPIVSQGPVQTAPPDSPIQHVSQHNAPEEGSTGCCMPKLLR